MQRESWWTPERVYIEECRQHGTLPKVLARFQAKTRPNLSTGCIEWTAALDKDGYGIFRIGSAKNGTRRNARAARMAWELYCGPIPLGHQPDHLCHNRPCINIYHLELVTDIENVLRGESPPAKNARKTHCPKGHPYDSDNTYIDPKGARHCRTCGHEENKRFKKRRKQRLAKQEETS